MATAKWDLDSRISRRVKLRDLHILSVVVHCGSMAKAAPHLAMSQSVVSEAIANLEEALHVRLLDRSPQGIEPTIYARALLKRGQVIFDELNEGIKDIEFLADQKVGEVRLACPEFLSSGFLPLVIDRFSRSYPRVVIRVVQQDTTTLQYPELRERVVDLLLTRIHSMDDDVDVEHLFDDPQFVVAGSNSPWAQRPAIDLRELVDEPWILPPSPTTTDLIKCQFEARGLKGPSVMLDASSILLRKHMLGTGRFLSVMPHSIIESTAKEWSIQAIPVDLRLQGPPIAVVTLKHRTLSPVVQMFIEDLRQVAKTMSSAVQTRTT
jgi:DNA-binding transcriptional LysR family regulator